MRYLSMPSYLLMLNAGSQLASRAMVAPSQYNYISGRLFTSQNPTPALLDGIQQWFNRCEREHPRCRNNPPGLPLLPDRVIYVPQDDDNLHIQDGLERHAQYATLSYCWGGYSEMKTTTENLQLRKASLSLADLPKTFKDAVSVCKRLGISYLWIDSLCIVQDSMADWENQSAVMDSIYYNSTITLAAAAACNPTRGLFIPTTPWLEHFPLPRTFWDDNEQVYLRPHVKLRPDKTDFLRDRGWCTQERQLSRRLLYFHNGELEWTCLERIWAHDRSARAVDAFHPLRHMLELLEKSFEKPYKLVYGDESRGSSTSQYNAKTGTERMHDSIDIASVESPDNHTYVLLNLRGISTQDASTLETITCRHDEALFNFLDKCVRHSIYHFWYKTVEKYAKSRLTFAADKLPALAGIASRVHAITQHDYLAGHWRCELSRSLFWGTFEQFHQPRRVVPYRAPSWSWASMDTASMYWKFGDSVPSSDPVRIIAAEVDLDGQNPFGRVLSGFITMQAHVLSASWNASKAAWVTPSRVNHDEDPQPPDTGPTFEWSYDDEINAILPGEPLTSESSQEAVEARQIHRTYGAATRKSENARLYGEGVDDWQTLWERGTYIPTEVLLVKGPYEEHLSHEVKEYGTAGKHIVLVLARVHDEQKDSRQEGTEGDAQLGGELTGKAMERGPLRYRRVGLGRVRRWDEGVQRIETLTVV
jgi:hypothetical protein